MPKSSTRRLATSQFVRIMNYSTKRSESIRFLRPMSVGMPRESSWKTT